MNIDIQIKSAPLLIQECLDFVHDPGCGGIDVFIGNVRNQTKGKPVLKLEFESYVPMAKSEMQKIAEYTVEHLGVSKVCIHHRIGTLQIGEAAVIIAVSSPHRKAAFSACQYAIDTLKETVPIWKKEIFEDGEIWVAATP